MPEKPAICHHGGQDFAWDDESHIVPTTEFDFDEVDRRLHGNNQVPARNGKKPVTVDYINAIRALEEILEWVWQDGSRDARGIQLRALAVIFLLLRPVRENYMQKEIAKRFGFKKQSLGRWVEHFKARHPWYRSVRTQWKSRRRTATHERVLANAQVNIRRAALIRAEVDRGRLDAWPPEMLRRMADVLRPVSERVICGECPRGNNGDKVKCSNIMTYDL